MWDTKSHVGNLPMHFVNLWAHVEKLRACLSTSCRNNPLEALRSVKKMCDKVIVIRHSAHSRWSDYWRKQYWLTVFDTICYTQDARVLHECMHMQLLRERCRVGSWPQLATPWFGGLVPWLRSPTLCLETISSSYQPTCPTATRHPSSSLKSTLKYDETVIIFYQHTWLTCISMIKD